MRPEKGDLTEPRQHQSTDLSEAEAIERAKLGDAEAFQVLYDKHKRRVYSLCLRMTANTAEAEDLAQEAARVTRIRLNATNTGKAKQASPPERVA